MHACMFVCVRGMSIYLPISTAICQLTNHTYICGLKLTNSLVLWINHCIKNVLPDSKNTLATELNQTLNIYWGVERHGSKQARSQKKNTSYIFYNILFNLPYEREKNKRCCELKSHFLYSKHWGAPAKIQTMDKLLLLLLLLYG